MDSSVWAYDFNTNAWQEKESSSAPGPRATHAMAYADSVGKVFMYGGTENGTREFRSYDYNSNTWEHIEEPIPFPGTRSRFAMVYIPDTDQLVVFGGQIGSQCYKYTNETWVYDVTTNTWTNVTREEP